MNVSALTAKTAHYARLMRMDKPIGTFLLLAPTLWALWIAAAGRPSAQHVLIFAAGVFVMRSAGCVINDYADRDIDPHVARTRARPLAAGDVGAAEALALFLVLGLAALALVLQLPAAVFKWAVAALAVTVVYPFLKRYIQVPQLVLGVAFSFGIPMAFAAHDGAVPPVAWLLFAANLLWTVAYDTIYAMVDRDDDLKIGVKSTAILFGRRDRVIVALLQCLTLISLFAVGRLQGLGGYYLFMLLIAAATFVYQQVLMGYGDRELTFRAFLNNAWFGLLVWAGLVLAYL